MPGYRVPRVPGSAGLTSVSSSSGRPGSSSDGSSSDSPAAGEFSRDLQYITIRITADGAGSPGPCPGRLARQPGNGGKAQP
jgi:hypothetical protein